MTSTTPPSFHRYNRDYVVEGEPYAGYDRHNAEVAAFHLDRYYSVTHVGWGGEEGGLLLSASHHGCSTCHRILGFRRAPLVVGRFVNLLTDIKPVATDQLLSTFLTQGTCSFLFHTRL